MNEADNPIADQAFESAIKYVQKHPDLGIEINVQRAVGKRPDAKGILASCKYFCIFLKTHLIIVFLLSVL